MSAAVRSTAEQVPSRVRPTLPCLRYAENSGVTSGDIRLRMPDPQIELPQILSNRKLVLAGQLAFLPTGILTTILGPMLPILIARWVMNDTQAGNLFLVQFLASLVGVQLSGVLLARFGFRPAFLLGLLLMAGGVATLYMGSLGLGLAVLVALALVDVNLRDQLHPLAGATPSFYFLDVRSGEIELTRVGEGHFARCVRVGA